MEICVNDYVRTKDGLIAKVLSDDGLFLDIDKRYFNECYQSMRKFITYEQIAKHSKNIIDLIEVGDYVNGYKVSFIDKDYKTFVQCDYPVQEGTTNHYRFYEEAIYSIVTHEQFNSIKYEVI